MECARWQEAISARLDGEDPGIDLARVDAHLARCGRCRAFAADAASARPRIGAAAAVPDLSNQVRGAVAASDRAGHWGVVRAMLVVVAVEIIAFSLPALILGDEQDTAAHAARHLGAFTAAYAVGLLVVAIRPARARTMLPVTIVLAGALSITAVVDLVEGRVPLVGEAQHLPEVLSVVLVWLLAVPVPAPTIGVFAARGPRTKHSDTSKHSYGASVSPHTTSSAGPPASASAPPPSSMRRWAGCSPPTARRCSTSTPTVSSCDHTLAEWPAAYGARVDVAAAARRWSAVWQSAWASKDVEAIVALYADSACYRALVLRVPELGTAGVRAYLTRTFAEEDDIECRFGVPVVGDDRAAVEWWASWREEGEELTMAGVTMLRFDDDGLVVDHRDYWNQSDRREPPFDGW